MLCQKLPSWQAICRLGDLTYICQLGTSMRIQEHIAELNFLVHDFGMPGVKVCQGSCNVQGHNLASIVPFISVVKAQSIPKVAYTTYHQDVCSQQWQ